jgi:sterol 3beta-glucosyltransferase
MTKNKGFFLAAPTEIAIQRKQLKEIIFSLLPACTEPDLDTGTPFRAQAIIANPPAYGGSVHHGIAILHQITTFFNKFRK